MKKTYMKPMTVATRVEPLHMTCASLPGVDGTANFRTDYDDDDPTTNQALSRRTVWDDETDEDY